MKRSDDADPEKIKELDAEVKRLRLRQITAVTYPPAKRGGSGNSAATPVTDGNQVFTFFALRIKNDTRIYYRGPYLPDQLIQILSEIDIVIIPSMIESFSFTVRESLSAYVPVIASNVGGIPEIIKHMENGILFDPTRIGELTAIIQNIHKSADSI